MTIDELKAEWNRTSLRVEELEKDNAQLANELRCTKLQPSLRKLQSTYLWMAILSVAMLLIGIPFFKYYFAARVTATMTLPLFFWEFLFLICTIADTTLYYRVKGINLSEMSVSDVATRARSCRKFHLLSQAVLLPIAIAFICVFFLDVDPDARIGIIIGGAIGFAIGLRKWLQIMRSYKALMSE